MGHWQKAKAAVGADEWEELYYTATKREIIQILSGYTSALTGYISFHLYPAGAQHAPTSGPSGRDGLLIAMGETSQDYMGLFSWVGRLVLEDGEEIRCLFHRTTAADVLRFNVGIRP
jgi:hypothetical protein